MTPDAVLTVDGLEKTFTLHARGRQLSSLRGASFQVHAGRLTALVGPSGAGKSTVLKCIHRTYLPSAGRVVLHLPEGDLDLARADERTVLAARRDHLGFVTQFLHALPRQPALAVVASPLIARGIAAAEAQARAAAALESLGLPRPLWDLPPATFSGGERQRVNLARGLVSAPRLLLLDEPTASLDRGSAALAVAAVRALRDAGTAVLAIFHDPELVASLADAVVELTPAAQEAA